MNRFAPLSLSALLLLATPGLSLAQGAPQGQETTQARVQRLIRDLGANEFETRQAAQQELEKIGAAAIPALEEASHSQDPEVAARATEALARIRGGAPQGEAPAREEPQDPALPPGLGQPVPLPDMGDVFQQLQRELEQSMPEEFRSMFRDMFRRDGQPGQPEEREAPGGPRVRVWSWSNRDGAQVIEGGTEALGMGLGPAGAALRAQLGLPAGEGLVVNQLQPGGWAEQAGVELYDVIVAVDGRAVRGVRDLQPLEAKACELEVMRRAQSRKLSVPQAPAPGQGGTRPAPAPQPAPGGKQGSNRERSF